MKCDEVLELVSDYVDGAMEKPLRVAVDAHLADCTSCRETVDGVGRLWSRLDALPAVDPPAALHTAVWAGIGNLAPAPRAARRAGFSLPALADMLRPRSLALAAAAVIILSAFVSVSNVQKAELGPGWLIQLVMHRAPAKSTSNSSYAEWTRGSRGVELLLHLQLPALAPGARYGIQIVGAASASMPHALATTGITTLIVPLSSAPVGDSLDVTATPESGSVAPLHLHLKLWPR